MLCDYDVYNFYFSGYEVYFLGEVEKWMLVNKMWIVGINYLDDDLLINIFGKYGLNVILYYVIDG